jgi:hypothetical protein
LNFSINGNLTSEAVVGSNSKPESFLGRVTVSGQFTAYFENATLRDLFINETESSLICAFSTNNTATADFLSFSFPRIKTGGATKDDGEKGLIQTIPFTALYNSAGGATTASTHQTTIQIQDSLIP